MFILVTVFMQKSHLDYIPMEITTYNGICKNINLIQKGGLVMEQKKYLNFFNKFGYGTGDWAANMVYGLSYNYSRNECWDYWDFDYDFKVCGWYYRRFLRNSY